MHQLIQKLYRWITEHPERSCFNPPASPQEIQSFEKSMGIRLPEEMAVFYRAHNGGFIADRDLKDDWDSRWNSYYFLSLAEITGTMANTTGFSARIILGKTETRGIKIIPFVHTPVQEWLVLRVENLPETPVIATEHEYSLSVWETVYPSFKDLLDDYILMEGGIYYM